MLCGIPPGSARCFWRCCGCSAYDAQILLLHLSGGLPEPFLTDCLELRWHPDGLLRRQGLAPDPAGGSSPSLERGVDLVARKSHKVLGGELGSHGCHGLGIGGVKAKYDLVEGVGVDSGPDVGWQLVAVLVGQGEGQTQPSGLCQSIGEVGGQGQIVLQLVNICCYVHSGNKMG